MENFENNQQGSDNWQKALKAHKEAMKPETVMTPKELEQRKAGERGAELVKKALEEDNKRNKKKTSLTVNTEFLKG
ncbi:hypothetical protein [Spirosoma panaciterrae]|uniref:hypothetical protein n=1 Tax=Spirosoma panaciterrae TaxID=496058 RepID=UPI00039ED693|nr:hypothetical protein [Spirosoma panaciterrae]